MRGVPPEIDALMWNLAEEGGPVAQAEFEQRHARYGPELARRIRMVAELRAAGKPAAHRPSFSPRPLRTAATPRWALAAVAGLAVLAVGAVAYVATSEAKGSPSVPAPVRPPVETAVVPKIDTSPAPLPTPEIVTKPVPAPVAVQPAPEKKPKYLEPRDVRIEDTSLVGAIGLVAAGGGLKATVAPGFKDQTVTLDYRRSGLNTLEILQAMGNEYGFSVLDEGDGEILVVPAREAAPPLLHVGP